MQAMKKPTEKGAEREDKRVYKGIRRCEIVF